MSTPQSGAASRRVPNARRRGAQRNRSAANPTDDTEQVKVLRSKYTQQLSVMQEMFPDWTDEDLLFVLQEANGDIELAVGRISEGHASQFSSVKTKKQTRKDAAATNTAVATPVASTGSSTAATGITSAPTQSSPATDATHPRARASDRGGRGRDASTIATRAGRGGFRGVGGRGGGMTGAPRGGKPDSKPITTTSSAFPASQTPSQSAQEPSSGAASGAATSNAAEKPKSGLSWAQIARPIQKVAEKLSDPTEPTTDTPTTATSTRETNAQATSHSLAEPPIDAGITQNALAMDAAQHASGFSGLESNMASYDGSSTNPAAAYDPSSAQHSVSRQSRARAHQDAPVVMPGGASKLDHLGVQFGSMNFMSNDDKPSAANAEDPSSDRVRFGEVDPSRDTNSATDGSFQHANLDAFKSHHGFGSGAHHAYGLGGGSVRQQPNESLHSSSQATQHGATTSSSQVAASPHAVSSGGFTNTPASTYNNASLDAQRNALYYGHQHGGSTVSSLRGDERASSNAAGAPTQSGPAGQASNEGLAHPQNPGSLPQQQPTTPAAGPGMQQQPFPNVMPYYYPYYMPNQFQHYASPAGGFGQYQMYGGQPQQHPSKSDGNPTGPNLSSPYPHHGPTEGIYGTQTPPAHFQPHSGSSASYDAQGFGQRVPTSLGQGANEGFHLQGNTESDSGSLPGLSNFLSSGQSQQSGMPPQGRGNAPNAASQSSPLDYRSFDAGKSPAGGANRTASSQPMQQHQHQPQPPAQQHPSYYHQYMGNYGHQNNAAAYNGYSYGRQQQPPYWG
ncbi:RNAPII degradation factor [Malassezia yamatoensis]|uniref:RNA polymerase II degradation factor 1 n=1 Tax=Malassezia yamatoensis TaxID=253288 RepID=A0AAJ6CFL5_9BASI|nr:RNAPII degradation factor [Malassezia yamatoensis]